MAGKNRWGSLPVAAEADSDEGKELIEEGMKAMKEEFLRNVELIKKAVNDFHLEMLFEMDSFPSKLHTSYGIDFRYNCYSAGRFRGRTIWLYDQDGEGIQTPRHLKDVLEKWKSLYEGKENPNENLKVWVVPADVHY